MKLIIFLLLTNIGYSQIINDYYNFFETDRTHGTYIFKDKKYPNINQKISYLGEIRDRKSNQVYKVLTSFTNLEGKGVNDLIFVNIKLKETYIYKVNVSSDFPIGIKKNSLIFKDEFLKKKTMMQIDTLNEIFCTPFECFDRTKN